MCGGGPVATLLLLAEKAGRPKVQILARTDSSSSGGPVVGYLAAAVFVGHGRTRRRRISRLPRRKRPRSFAWPARPSPNSSGEAPRSRTGRGSKSSATPRGVFVTLTRNGELRGCIGFIEPVLPLGQAVIRTAVYAATEDPRFPRVAAAELGDIRFEISVLTPAREIDDPKADQGRHPRPDHREGRPAAASSCRRSRSRTAGTGRPSSIRSASRPGCRADAWKRGAKLSVFEAIVFHE